MLIVLKIERMERPCCAPMVHYVHNTSAHWDGAGIDDITLDADEFVEELWAVGIAMNLVRISCRLATLF